MATAFFLRRRVITPRPAKPMLKRPRVDQRDPLILLVVAVELLVVAVERCRIQDYDGLVPLYDF
jgi:hypothetical protein